MALTAIAQAVLGDLVAEPGTPISAAELGGLVGLSGGQTGAYLRELRNAGLAECHPVSPGSTRMLWTATEVGRAHPRDMAGIDRELAALEARLD